MCALDMKNIRLIGAAWLCLAKKTIFPVILNGSFESSKLTSKVKELLLTVPVALSTIGSMPLVKMNARLFAIAAILLVTVQEFAAKKINDSKGILL